MSRGRWWHSGGGQVRHSRVWGILLSQHQPSKCILSRHPTFEGGEILETAVYQAPWSQVGSGGGLGTGWPGPTCFELPGFAPCIDSSGGTWVGVWGFWGLARVGQVVSKVAISPFSCLCALHWHQPLPRAHCLTLLSVPAMPALSSPPYPFPPLLSPPLPFLPLSLPSFLSEIIFHITISIRF